MGWIFKTNQSKADLIADRTRNQETEGCKYECLSYRVIGNHLWKISKYTNKETGKVIMEICLDLLSSQKNYGWGYKDLCESMGPSYYDCPLSFLNECPAVLDSQYAVGWRDAVRQYHASKKIQKSKYANVEIGRMYTIIGSDEVPNITITGKHKNRWVGVYNGNKYQIPAEMLGDRIDIIKNS